MNVSRSNLALQIYYQKPCSMIYKTTQKSGGATYLHSAMYSALI